MEQTVRNDVPPTSMHPFIRFRCLPLFRTYTVRLDRPCRERIISIGKNRLSALGTLVTLVQLTLVQRETLMVRLQHLLRCDAGSLRAPSVARMKELPPVRDRMQSSELQLGLRRKPADLGSSSWTPRGGSPSAGCGALSATGRLP